MPKQTSDALIVWHCFIYQKLFLTLSTEELTLLNVLWIHHGTYLVVLTCTISTDMLSAVMTSLNEAIFSACVPVSNGLIYFLVPGESKLFVFFFAVQKFRVMGTQCR
jgi:hypothetical protein